MIALLTIALFASSGLPAGFSAEIREAADDAPARRFKVVGYYSGDLFQEPVERLQTDKLTHVVYAFLIPTLQGGLEPLQDPAELRMLVEQAHADGAQVIAALGGWSYAGHPLAPVFESLAASAETRGQLVEHVRQLVREYGLDGVELDWEHPNAQTIGLYEQLVLDMRAAMRAEGKLLTAALNGAWSGTEGPEASRVVTEACLESFDFVNVMAYDMNNGEHSPYWLAEASLDYWLNRGVPAEKLVLGMPLYARPSWLQYRELTALDPANAWRDFADTSPHVSYYNGLNTLREKTWLALRKASGVMLFDVNEDSGGETGVVNMISQVLTQADALSAQDLEAHVTIVLDRKELILEARDGAAFIDENGRTLVPVRKPLEAVGAEVSYDEANRLVFAEAGGTRVVVPIGEAYILVNGLRQDIDTTAVIRDDRAYAPFRAVLEAFGYTADWRAASRTIYIDMEPADRA
jgi:GH18 family chitinase